MTKIIQLKWKIDDKGDYVAIAPNGMYRVTYEDKFKYRVRFAGFPIALATSDQGAKDYASIHVNRKSST